MKKLLTNLILVAFVTGFLSATPCINKVKVAVAVVCEASSPAPEKIKLPQQHTDEIEPLDIFSFRFN